MRCTCGAAVWFDMPQCKVIAGLPPHIAPKLRGVQTRACEVDGVITCCRRPFIDKIWNKY